MDAPLHAPPQIPDPVRERPSLPSQAVQMWVNQAVGQMIATVSTKGLIALAVVGSASRGEETWSNGELVGDIDLIAVIQDADPLTGWRLQKAAQSMRIALGCLPLFTLRKYRTLEWYEAKKTGWVAWGKPDIFDSIRMQTAADIPPWEALRLVLNRAADCLKVRAGLSPSWYGAVKTYLALAEAELILHQQDQPTYAGRWAQIASNGMVLGSKQLLERAGWATRVKLGLEIPHAGILPMEYESCLLDGIVKLLDTYLGNHPGIDQGLEILALRNHHWTHRALSIVQHWRQPQTWLPCLRQDPVFPIWRTILAILAGQLQPSRAEMFSLLADFDRTLQPLST